MVKNKLFPYLFVTNEHIHENNFHANTVNHVYSPFSVYFAIALFDPILYPGMKLHCSMFAYHEWAFGSYPAQK